jgi:uncharacterized protein (DUF58 family)
VLIPLGLTAVLGVLASLTDEPWLAAAAVAPLALAVASVAWALAAVRHLPCVSVHLVGPPRTAVGERLAQQLVVVGCRHGRRPPLTVEVHQHGLGTAGTPLPAGEGPARVLLERPALHRAAATTAVVALTTSDVLQLVRWTREVVLPSPLVVHPRRVAPATVPARPSAGAGSGAPRRSRTGDLAGVRGWQRGDAVRDVHWRATARTGRPVVSQREEPTGASVVVVLAGDVTEPDEERLALAAATSLAARRLDPAATVLAAPRAGEVLRAPVGSAGALLDWWSALDGRTGSAPATPQDVLAAVPSGGTAVVVGTSALTGSWWDGLAEVARRRGIVLERVR